MSCSLAWWVRVGSENTQHAICMCLGWHGLLFGTVQVVTERRCAAGYSVQACRHAASACLPRASVDTCLSAPLPAGGAARPLPARVHGAGGGAAPLPCGDVFVPVPCCAAVGRRTSGRDGPGGKGEQSIKECEEVSGGGSGTGLRGTAVRGQRQGGWDGSDALELHAQS